MTPPNLEARLGHSNLILSTKLRLKSRRKAKPRRARNGFPFQPTTFVVNYALFPSRPLAKVA